MTRQQASELLNQKLVEHGLSDWGVRLNQNADSRFLGLCSYKDKCIILSAHHIDIHPEPDVRNTILHEVAHALCPGHGHDDVWASKAKEIGCDNTLPCSNLSLSPEVIDAIRSGANVEVTFDTQVIRTPRYNITRLQDKCEYCGKVAKTESEQTIVTADPDKPNLKYIRLECGHLLIKKIPKGTPWHKFQAFGDPSCQHKWEKNTCLSCNRKRLYEFQVLGAEFLEAGLAVNKGCACFDDMGLGKTLQVQAITFFHEEYHPVLWIMKSSAKYQTATSIMKWNGNSHVPQVIESGSEYLIPGLKHYIISYDMLVPKVRKLKSGKTITSGFDITQFDRVGIKLVILDECQQIKNVDSSRTQMVRRVVKDRKVLLTSGTPWNNRGSELFPAFNMMDPIKFNSEAGFRRNWVATYWQGRFEKEGGIRNIKAFKEYTKDLCIRRERIEVMPELPLVNRTKLYVKMDAQQEQVYDEAVNEFVAWYEAQVGDLTGMAIIAAMQKMRHLVAIAKIPATLEYVDEFVEDTDRKLVVFAHHKDAQAMLFEEIKQKYGADMPVLRLVSEMDASQRFETQNKFNESPRAILVASQLAAGDSINLQTCCDCVMHERQWNPGKEEQCEGRFPRPGTTATQVNAIYTHLEGITTIDPQLDEMVERKRVQYHNVMNKTEMQPWNENVMMKELAATIVNAHNAKKNRRVVAKGA